MSEKDLCNSIIEYINYHGCYCWRVNSGMIRAETGGKRRMIRLAAPGTSDIQGIRKRDGRFICLEVKLPKTRKNVTVYQEEYLKMMSKYGALTGVVTSPEEALIIIEEKK